MSEPAANIREVPWCHMEAKTLYLQEYEVRTIPESHQELYDVFSSIPRGSFHLVDVTEIRTDQSYLVFTPNSRVGVQVIEGFTIYVLPKVHSADFLTMANYAFDLPDLWDQELVNLARQPRNLIAIFITLFLLRVKDFVSKDLKRSFIKREEDLTSKIKGKVLLPAYLQRNMPTFNNHIVPCQYHDITYDCLENRIILYTIDLIQKVLPQVAFSQPLRGTMQRLCTFIRSRLSSVSYQRIGLADFNRVRYTGRFRKYQPLHELCKMILESLQIDMKHGQVNFRGFYLDMNLLFENFVIGVLRREGKLDVDYQTKRAFAVGSEKKTIRPDGWLEEHNVLLDTKYKAFFETSVHEETVNLQSMKIRHTDIYQILAYCNHSSFQDAAGILIYPGFSTGHRQSKEECYAIRGFNRNLYAVLIDLNFTYEGGKPREVTEFVERFKQILKEIR